MEQEVAEHTYVDKQKPGAFRIWKDKRPLINRLDVELTERCNNNCAHCYINLPADDTATQARELAAKDIQEVLIEAAGLGCMTVRFTGGEPLLRNDFEALYLFARRLGLKVMLFTNATRITPHLADLFARIPPLEKIEVTVYGMAEASYEAVSRTPGSCETAWQGIRLLMERKVPFIVKGVLLPSTKGETEQFEEWAAIIPWMDKPPSQSMNFDLRCRRDSEAKNRHVINLRLSPEETLLMLTRRPESYIKSMKEFSSKFMSPQGDVLFSCGSGVGGACLDAYGMLQPCMMLRHPDTVYDLRRGSLRDSMTRFFPGLRTMRATNADYLARCARCFLKGLCEQCPAKSWMEHGTLDTPVDYLCQVAHAQARYLGLVGGSEWAWEVSNWRERIKAFAES